MRILFLGSGAFAVPALEALVRGGHAPVSIATVPDAPRGRGAVRAPTPVKVCADGLGLGATEVEKLREPQGGELLAATGAELVITADIRLFLPESFLERVPAGCYNLHPSLLPRWRGAAPVPRSILAGDFHLGVTLYRMVKEMDAGPIVAAREAALEPRKLDAPTAEALLADSAAGLLLESLPALLSGSPSLRAQDARGVTFAPRLRKEEGWIDWSRPADEIENHVLAMKRWPRSFTVWHHQRAVTGTGALLLMEEAAPLPASLNPRAAPLPPGTIRAAGAAGIDVACGAGGDETLRVVRLQREGGRVLSAADFMRGVAVEAGDRLGRREDEKR